MKVDDELKDLGGLYGLVRSGFVHKYLLTKKSFVATHSDSPLKCVIIYNRKEDPEIIFVVEDTLNILDVPLRSTMTN